MHIYSDGVIFLLLARTASQLTGYMDIVTIHPGTADPPVIRHATMSGTAQSSSVSLTASWDSLYTTTMVGVDDGRTITLSWSGDNGQAVTIVLTYGATPDDYNAAVARLEAPVIAMQKQQAVAQKLAEEKQQWADRITGIDSKIGNDLWYADYDLQSVRSSLQDMTSKIAQMKGDLIVEKSDLVKEKGDASVRPMTADQSYRVEDDSYTVNDDMYTVDDDGYSVNSELSSFDLNSSLAMSHLKQAATDIALLQPTERQDPFPLPALSLTTQRAINLKGQTTRSLAAAQKLTHVLAAQSAALEAAAKQMVQQGQAIAQQATAAVGH
jgi:hypothetical protein